MHLVDDIEQLDQLLAEIEEFNKRDRESIARAKVEREKWLEERRNGKKKKDQD